jgi:hypothetical protein
MPHLDAIDAIVVRIEEYARDKIVSALLLATPPRRAAPPQKGGRLQCYRFLKPYFFLS